MEDGVIVGFHGRASQYVDAIGVYVKTMQQEVWVSQSCFFIEARKD